MSRQCPRGVGGTGEGRAPCGKPGLHPGKRGHEIGGWVVAAEESGRSQMGRNVQENCRLPTVFLRGWTTGPGSPAKEASALGLELRPDPQLWSLPAGPAKTSVAAELFHGQ